MLTRVVDVSAIRRAIKEAKEISASRVLLVVKANAYGAGYEAALAAADLTDGLAVARAAEGARLRALGYTGEILVLSYGCEQARTVAEYGLTPSVGAPEQMELLEKYGVKRCHIAVDTGMSRHGVKGTEGLIKIVDSAKTVKISGLYTHIFNNGASNALRQARRFDVYKRRLDALIGGGYTTHVSASGALETLKGRYDAVRLGIGAYREANYIISSVIGVKRVRKGESVGYDGAYVAERDIEAAIIEGGYADGIPRSFTGHKIMINNDFCRVIGNICMDVFMADVSGTGCRVGDRAVLLDNDRLTLKDLSAATGRIEYETLTAFQGRINRVIFVNE